MCVCSRVWGPVQSGWDGHGLVQLHGASTADAEAADVQPRDVVADHGEPAGAEHDVQPRSDAADDRGQPTDAAADGAQPGNLAHAQQS